MESAKIGSQILMIPQNELEFSSHHYKVHVFSSWFLQCPIEWFHYGCVGLTQAPKGKWFCPQCTAAIKRRGRRN